MRITSEVIMRFDRKKIPIMQNVQLQCVGMIVALYIATFEFEGGFFEIDHLEVV